MIPAAAAGPMIARITPYEMFLESLEASAFPAIRTEAERRGRDTRRRDQFVLLGSVGATLRAIVPEDGDADAIEEYADFLYHGYLFWSYGRRLYVFDEPTTQWLTQPELDLGDWIFAGPPSCYLQFPYQRLWARVTPEAPYEPIDGCFVVADETEIAPGAGAHLRTQLVLGLRPDRPGASLVSYRTDLEPEEVAALAQRPWRDDADPYASAIPGGEKKGFRTLATTSELEALVIRGLHVLDRHLTALSPADPGTTPGETRLPHTRVHWSGR